MYIHRFEPSLVNGKLIKRYKRFLVDVLLDDGQVVTAHCTNSGSMLSCLVPGAPVLLSPTNNPERKTRFTWEMIQIDGKWVGINTSNPNRLVGEYLKRGTIPSLGKWDKVVPEYKIGNSRLDFYAERADSKCFVEVKNVTLKEGDFARFPDAVTSRGLKHLDELHGLVNKGYRGVILYIVQRSDVTKFGPAWDIDPKYASRLVEVQKDGVEIIAFQVEVGPEAIIAGYELPIDLDLN